VNQFESPSQSLEGLDVESAASVIAAAADVALVLDNQGVIRDVAGGSEDLTLEGYRSWVGQPWEQTVTVESRPKVVALLKEAGSRATRKWRHVNHPSAHGADVPVLYSAVQVGKDGRVIALGRDLRAVAALQQRLVDAQQSMERDYWRLRHVETRYRMLFQTSSEAVFIIDAATLKVVEANPAAGQLFSEPPKRLIGKAIADVLHADSRDAVQSMLTGARAAVRADDIVVRAAHTVSGAGVEMRMSAMLFRQESSSYLLVRFIPSLPLVGIDAVQQGILQLVGRGPDGFVVTDAEGRILSANTAFLDIAQLATAESVRGESLDRWLGRPGVDLNVLLSNLRQYGTVRLFATNLRGEHGATEDVEISAVALTDAGPTTYGFVIRNIGRRLSTDFRLGRDLPRSVEQLTELVGRVSLKDLLRESTDLIEKLCIQAALQLTRDNRASAAELLGLSRQSLYVKLRRYGLGDLGHEEKGLM
jgi:transcriptional regulator PpsR